MHSACVLYVYIKKNLITLLPPRNMFWKFFILILINLSHFQVVSSGQISWIFMHMSKFIYTDLDWFFFSDILADNYKLCFKEHSLNIQLYHAFGCGKTAWYIWAVELLGQKSEREEERVQSFLVDELTKRCWVLNITRPIFLGDWWK